jgi:DNA-binding LacI/PurR family transcriptional regulator
MTDKAPRQVLLADVARVAKVSMATASMALRAEGKMTAETRAMVRRVAEEIGYRPNLAAAMLARQREGGTLPNVPIAVVGMGIRNRYAFPAPHFISAFTEHASRRGFLVEEPEATYPSISKLLRVLYHRGVRGIVLSHDFDTSPLTAGDVNPFCFLVHGQPFKKTPFHRVSTEVFEGTKLLWEVVWQRGYRRIGAALFRHPQDIQDDFAREAAVLNCQERYQAPRIPLFTGPLTDADGLERWRKEVRPDAVIGFSDWQYDVLRAAGFKIPGEMGFAALHVKQGGAVCGLYEDFDELGRMTAAQLDNMIRHNETGFPVRPHQLLVSAVFNDGETLPLRIKGGEKSGKNS